MAFTSAEKVDIRRYCGFPAYASFGWVYEVDYGMLETRMNGMSSDEEAIIRTIHLPRLALLETDLLTARSNLDTDVAAVWTHNKNEVADRFGLYNRCRRELCGYIGVRPGAGLRGGGNVIRT